MMGVKVFLEVWIRYFSFEFMEIVNYFTHLSLNARQVICPEVLKVFGFARRLILRVVWFGVFYFQRWVDIKVCNWES